MKISAKNTHAQKIESAGKVFLASKSGEPDRYTDLQRVQAMETLLVSGKLETYAPPSCP